MDRTFQPLPDIVHDPLPKLGARERRHLRALIGRSEPALESVRSPLPVVPGATVDLREADISLSQVVAMLSDVAHRLTMLELRGFGDPSRLLGEIDRKFDKLLDGIAVSEQTEAQVAELGDVVQRLSQILIG